MFLNKISYAITGRAGAEGSRKLRLPDFLTTAQYGCRLSALRTGRLYPQEYSWYSFSLGGRVDPRAMVWSEGNMSLKNPVTPPGIDPGTFRLIAQRLNHYATSGPILLRRKFNFFFCEKYQEWLEL
jgi:hypothetical protein